MEILPLTGIRVLDLTRMVSGAFCTLILGDLGAEVIKIERPGIGDDTRNWGPPFINGESAYFISINRNKKSVTLNLKQEQGQEIFRRLVQHADVVIENFKAGTMEKFRLDYQSLKKIRPDLIYCSITGFGLSGPYQYRVGTDPNLQAMGGIIGLTGDPGGKPYRVPIPLVDISSGLYAHGAIMAALLAREREGKGQFIEISLLDTVVSLLINYGSTYLLTGEVPERMGNGHPTIVPFGVFEGKDGSLFLSASSDERWQKLCYACGLDELAKDPRFSQSTQRTKNKEELERLLQERLKGETVGKWLAVLEKAGIPSAPINTIDGVFNDPQVIDRQIVTEVSHQDTGLLKMVGVPVKYDGVRNEVRYPPPRLGEHVDEVLQKLLGCDRDEIDKLRGEGAV